MKSSKFSYEIGVGRVDITPPVGITMVGYKPRRSEGVGHGLEAEAVYCTDGESAWLLVVADFIGIRNREVNALRRRIHQRVGIAEGAVTIAGTHTHSGPPTILADAEDLTPLDREYLEKLWVTLENLAVDTVRSASPGRFESVSIGVPDLASNRRVELADGTWTNEWRDPEGNHPGYFDPSLVTVAVRRESGELSALLVNYGCHPVVLGPESLSISADYPGHLKDRLIEEKGVEVAAFLLSGAGNINPRNCIEVGEEHPRRMGGALAERVLRSLANLAPVAGGAVRTERLSWSFHRDRDSYKRAGLRGNREGDEVETDVCVYRAGALAVVTVPGELFSEINSELRRMNDLGPTLVVTLANDYIGYIPTDEAERQGAYEPKMAPHAEVAQMLVAKAGAAMAATAS